MLSVVTKLLKLASGGLCSLGALRSTSHLLSALSVALLIVLAACRDTTAPPRGKQVRMRPVEPAYAEDYETADSIHVCPQYECSDLTDQENNAVWTVIWSIQTSRSPACQYMFDALYDAALNYKIKSALHFETETKLGATDLSDMFTYLRKDILDEGPAYFDVALGHEGAHQAGYGWYQYHQQDMDNMSMGCFGYLE